MPYGNARRVCSVDKVEDLGVSLAGGRDHGGLSRSVSAREIDSEVYDNLPKTWW